MPDAPTDAPEIEQTTQEKMGGELDKELLRVLKEGRTVVTKKGDVVEVEATAADLNVVRQRLRDLGMNADPARNKSILELQALAKKKVKDFPDLPQPSDEPDALVG